MSAFELATSLRVGFTPDRIIVNGPCKNVPFLTAAVDAQVRLIVVDSLAEMNRLEQIARTSGTRPSILMRVNPDIRVRGLNKGSSTGSRKHCAFGLDVRSGEVEAALDLVRYSNLKFTGFHAHIGSGIREPGAYTRLVAAFDTLIRLARRKGLVVDCLDLGGGFPAPTSREFHSSELLAYQAFGRLPSCGPPPPTLQQFFETFGPSLRSCLRDHGITSVIFEPGRSIVSNAQLLLLTVEYIKRRAGTPSWVITDGGLGTVTLPTYYEYHEIIPALHPNGPEQEPFTILGPGCFAADIVVRNKNLPPINPGDVLAVMDSGAYFTSMESNFGYPRPAIVAVDSDGQSLWRERESHDYYIQRDIFRTCCQEERP
jgi:diaminopimelate decarboxylase